MGSFSVWGAGRRGALTLVLATASLLVPSEVAAKPTIFDPGTEILRESRPHADAYLDAMRDLGADVVRLRPTWRDTDLAQLDYLVAGARTRGMDLLLTPVAPGARLNFWPDGEITSGPAPAGPTVAEYAAFVAELGRRYPEVHRWAIWNEPELPNFFPLPTGAGDTPGRRYRTVFLAAQSALVASGHRPREVLLGETHPGPTLPFLREVLCLNRRWRLRAGCAPLTAGGWAHHPYIIAERPWYMTDDFIGTGDLPKLNQALWRAEQAGATRGKLPIYVTEFGVAGSTRFDAEMLSAAEWAMTRNPWVKSFAQYSLLDDWWQHGLLRGNASPKWSAIAFTHSVFVIRRGHQAVVLGHLRTGAGRTSVAVIDRSRSPKRLPVRTDRNGYFKLVTRWRPHRRWCVAGGMRVRAFGLNPPKRAEGRRKPPVVQPPATTGQVQPSSQGVAATAAC